MRLIVRALTVALVVSCIPSVAGAKGSARVVGVTLRPDLHTPGTSGRGTTRVARRVVLTCVDLGDASSYLTVTSRYGCDNGILGFRGCYGACLPPTPGAPPPPRPDVRAMIDSAIGNVPDPEPVTSPPLTDDDDVSVVGIPFFFSVPAEQWTTISPTATQGAYFLTINATPATLTFDPGIAGPGAQCDNPGRIVRNQRQARSAKSLGCFHTYQNAPKGSTSFPAMLSITWNLSVTTNLEPDEYVNLVPATLTTTTAFDVPVIELQPVLVEPGD